MPQIKRKGGEFGARPIFTGIFFLTTQGSFVNLKGEKNRPQETFRKKHGAIDKLSVKKLLFL
jgi:hypothetical protein